MSLTVQTNIASLIAQNNLSLNSEFMTQTITRLTSGYRINSSADDAAGLVIANEYRSNIAELTQGVRNANDGISTLQIIDGGLNNISTMLDRMKTLATESASGTFSGNRATLDQEYQQLISEISRQASNIGLNSGGSNNTTVNVFIGGGTQTNSQISVNLSGTGNTVDATGLGLTNTSLLGVGTTFTGNSVNLNSPISLLTGAANASQVFTFNLAGGQQVTATVTSPTSSGITVQNAVQQLNSALNPYGLAASVNSTGGLEVSGTTAFTGSVAAASSGTGLVTGASTISNGSNYDLAGAAPFTALAGASTETLTYTVGTSSTTVVLNSTNAATQAGAVTTLNSQLASLGLSAVVNAAGTGIDVQGPSAFSVSVAAGSAAGVYAANGGGSPVVTNAATPTVTGGQTTNALNAISALTNAIASLGNVQGTVGAGENKLNYAIGLANSQITSFSAAQSRIRDADMAAEAANLTKAQILEQSSIAAMAQANAAPQAVLALLK